MIRILYVNGGLMNRGGIESYMMNYYRHFDHSKVQIDFAVHDAGGCGYYDEEIRQLGGRIFVLPQKSKHPFAYAKRLNTLLMENDYRIIHTHMDAMGAWTLKVAKRCGVPIRIAHSHNTHHLSGNPIKLFFLERARKHVNRYVTHRMACSEAAGKWLFGKEDFQVIHNAIEIEKFLYDAETRARIRRDWHVGKDDFLIGHVGRFDAQKNHGFLIDVFRQVRQACPRCKLMLIGEGRLMGEVKAKVKRLHLEDAVIFTGSRSDVHLFYNAFDLFVLPSLFEGLPVVAIEAEVNGCECYLSDTITQEVALGHQAVFIPLEKKAWSDKIIDFVSSNRARHAASFNPYQSGYDIRVEAKKLQTLYLDLWGSA